MSCLILSEPNFEIFPLRGRLPPKTGKNGVFWYPHAPRATAQGIYFRSTTIVQSVSGDARDVPLTTEFLGWSYGLGATSVKVAHFFGNDARFTGLAQAARRSISATMLAGHMN